MARGREGPARGEGRGGFIEESDHACNRAGAAPATRGVGQPRGEVALVSSLVRLVLGADTDDAVVREALAARGRTDEPVGLSDTALLREGSADGLQAEVLEDADDDVRDQLARLREQRELASARAAAARAELEKQQEAVASGAGSAAGAPAPEPARVARRFVPKPGHGLSVEEAREYLPPGASITNDDRRENRWRVRAPYLATDHLGCERSRAWGSGVHTDWEALVWCLRLAWSRYCITHGGEPPWDFSEG